MRTKFMLAIAALLLLLMVPPASAQTFPKNPLNWVMAKRLTVATISTLTGAVTTGAGLTVGSDLTLTPATVITLTMNATLTPLGAYQPLASAGTVNTSSITAGTAGKELVLVNTTATTIVFTDTGTLKLSANISLGQYDSLTLISDGTNWIQRATSNN